jgi:hypothetical protein
MRYVNYIAGVLANYGKFDLIYQSFETALGRSSLPNRRSLSPVGPPRL